MRRGMAVALLALILPGGLFVAAWLVLGPSTPGSIVRDPDEAAVFQTQFLIEQHRIAVTQMSIADLLPLYADEFQGDTIFAAEEAEEDSPVPGVRVYKRGSSPVRRADLESSVTDFFNSVDVIVYLLMKVASTSGEEADIKVRIQARKGKGLVHVTDRFRATIRKGRIVSQKRVAGRRIESDRTAFSVEPLAVGPDRACHGCAYDMPAVQFGGVALGDYDGDGRIDIFTTGPKRSTLLANRGGRFEDVTKSSGLGAPGSGAIWFDADNDGDLDLGLAGMEELSVYINEKGSFTRRALNGEGPAYGLCSADIDLDGDLDIYVGRYGGERKSKEGLMKYGLGADSFLDSRNGKPNLLFLNDGKGHFREVGEKAGVADTGWTLACGFQDLDGDRYPDLYVVNDFGRNVLYRNRGDGTFEESDRGGDSGFGMGLARGDYDNDGDVDLHVSNMSSTAGNRILDRSNLAPDLMRRLRKAAAGNTLLRNDGTRLKDVESEVRKAGWAWGCVFCDYDNDGDVDLYVANGFVSGRTRTDL